MIVEGPADSEHWGRRLLASVPDNETEQNCSAPVLHVFAPSKNIRSQRNRHEKPATRYLLGIKWRTSQVGGYPVKCGDAFRR
ncbi:hypothetical protein EYF80_040743 [Liparis tanakae]|uniref:Uncharacterized protein n=1 Tax=Liparis tanakae TaxID=230148 RepID=A0A4Z2G7E1_9TELE|nr:hypothetical protein EYF80_040743 [Liparis tanakae]